MWHKTGPFAEILYLTLIVSLLRPDQTLVNQEIIYDSFGGSSVDDYGPTTAVQLYLHNLRNSIPSDPYAFPGAKTNILLQETLDVLRDLNSLGRYSNYNSNLFAYLVNANEETNAVLTPAVTSSSSSSSSSQQQLSGQQNSSVNISNPSSPSTSSEDSLLTDVSIGQF